MNNKNDFELALNSHFPLLVVETHEEGRVVELLITLARAAATPLQQWTITDGLKPLFEDNNFTTWGTKLELLPKEQDNTGSSTEQHSPIASLRTIKQQKRPGLYAMLDFHDHLDDPIAVRLIKEIALEHHLNQQRLIFISHELTLPNELQRFSMKLELSLPGREQLKQLLHEEAKLWALKKGNNIKADSKAMEILLDNLTGLTLTDAKRLLRNAIYDDGAITHDDIPEVQKAKYDLLSQEGLISFEYDTARFTEVGGMRHLKQWLDKRKVLFSNNSSNLLDTPKGILLVGVQGSGKSLAAKAVAGAWGVPLLRLDFAVLYNKYFGETEKNIRKAIQLAEAMSPCVLWIDEIEKGIATGDHDNGTSRRVLGTLLTWMAEKRGRVFIVATANDIQALPPELIRKGRLDEIFFVDLPTPKVREDIFRIHLQKRHHDPQQFDLTALAAAAHHFSGAEIEQAVVGACYSAHADNKPLNNQHLQQELAQTRPLAVVMAEKIEALRHWASERTVAAD